MGDKDTTPKWDMPHHPHLFVPIPVYTDDSYGHRRRPPLQRSSWWEYCLAWLRYQRTQLRWDIERSLARLLRRRW